MQKRLIVDLDSTLNDHWRRIRRCSKGGKIDPVCWTDKMLSKDRPLPGAMEALRRFKRAGWEVAVLTSRDWPTAWADSVRWLDAHGLLTYIDEVFTVGSMESKPGWLLGKRCDLFIDDLMSGQEKARPVFLWQVYKRLLEIDVPIEVFRNNWAEILERHLGP